MPRNEPLDMLKAALAHGIDEAYLIVTILAIAGIVAIAALLLATHVKLRTPDLQKFDEGQPALEARPLS